VVASALLGWLRGGLARIAWLVAVCQLALVIIPSAAIAAHQLQSGRASIAAEEECTCEHEAGVMCPMHRRSAPRPIPAGAPRWCGAGDDSLFALAPVLGALVAPEPIQTTVLTLPVVPLHTHDAARLLLLDRPPDSPPPRA
jgi:hypothetical protein